MPILAELHVEHPVLLVLDVPMLPYGCVILLAPGPFAREVPLDMIEAQIGHNIIQTTTSIYGRAQARIRRRAEELDKAFG